jgi:glycosyltransferase involved in cell wall biosynthesis
VRTDGKYFATDAGRFVFRGVTYGTFRPRRDSVTRYPPTDQVERDFAAMRDAGFSVVRTYTLPSRDVLELAGEFGLRLLPDVFYPDWRYLLGASRHERRRVAREARASVVAAARELAGCDEIVALSLGNEIPADVVRWFGAEWIGAVIAELVEVIRDADADRLVTYANYPTAEYLPLETLDFLTFNVFLEQRNEFRRYLNRLHHLAGDRPLVLAEIGRDAGPGSEGERQQAAMLDSQLETAVERAVAGTCIFSWTDEWWVGDAAVEGWRFGLTRADRSARPALEVARKWNGRTVRDVNFNWPSLSVVICAHNAGDTLDECLRHTCALDYPELEVIVVDDGSTDETAAIARRYDQVRVVRLRHSGLSVARNEGFRAARGDVVAYLDSDAYPPPEWPYYLVLGFDGENVAGVGGPNFVPHDDPPGAQRVARAPGGPLHVLVADDRAEHVPGCNMAFWKKFLEEIGGFDPIYDAAGDDVDLCWRVLGRGWEIGFHPGAMVWHRRRIGVRAYLRQQRSYGRAEALVEARHPARFTAAGTARWRGHIYDSFVPHLSRQRIYRGAYGSAAYQSVYRGGGHALDIVHQLGIPVAAPLVATALLAPWSPFFGVVAAIAAAMVIAVVVIDMARVRPPRRSEAGIRFRAGVALLNVLQPFARAWGRTRYRPVASQSLVPAAGLPGPVQRVGRSTLVLPEDRPRQELVECLVRTFRRRGLRVVPASEWKDYDGRVLGGALITGELVTSNHPLGYIQLRVRRRLRPVPAAASLGAAVAVGLLTEPLIGLALLAPPALDLLRGLWRTGPLVRRVVETAAQEHALVERTPLADELLERTAAPPTEAEDGLPASPLPAELSHR